MRDPVFAAVFANLPLASPSLREMVDELMMQVAGIGSVAAVQIKRHLELRHELVVRVDGCDVAKGLFRRLPQIDTPLMDAAHGCFDEAAAFGNFLD